MFLKERRKKKERNPKSKIQKISEYRHWYMCWSWKRKWQPTPVFLPGKSYGQRSLVGYRPWGCQRVGHDLVTKQQQTCC